MKLTIHDFSEANIGMLVKRSEHYLREHFGNNKEQIGIVVGKEYIDVINRSGKFVCFPVVFWEGDIIERMCHPANVVPYRAEQTLPIIEMEE